MKQRTEINSSYSTWDEIILGVTGSILSPLLFNIFLINLFFIIEDLDIASYADDNTPYVSANIIDGFAKSLEEASTELFKWSTDNLMKRYAKKCHLLVNTNNTVEIREKIALARLTSYIDISERRIVMNTFFNHGSATAFLYGCVTLVLTTEK